MKSIAQYIKEARVTSTSLKWGDKEWNVIEKMIEHVMSNKKHAEWYKKMANEKGNDYKFDIFYDGSPLLNNLDSWKRIKEHGRFGYWSEDGCSDFSTSMLSGIYYAINAEIFFHEEDSSKDNYTAADINTLKNMAENIVPRLPKGEFLNTREKVLAVVEPIVAKYDGMKIEKPNKYDNNVWISGEDFQPWYDCLIELEKEFDKYKNTVVGDGQYNEISISYED